MGKGGREHSLIYALKSSQSVSQVFALPGQEGFSPMAESLPAEFLTNKDSCKNFIKTKNIDLAVIGPEQELADGWSDFFRSEGLLVFGPSQDSACLESSKLFAKDFLRSAGICTSHYKKVHSVKEVLKEVVHFGFPVVLKADGLAGGKGVFICSNKKEAEKAAAALFEEKIFGSAGSQAFLEQYQKGKELSVFILTNGEDYKLLPFAKDYKKLNTGGKGPNTGGMGAIAPYFISEELKRHIHQKILKPTIQELKKRNLFYRGVLYIGLMITKEGVWVLEYNVRFGDPETQVILPLLDGDWAEVFYAIAKGDLPELKWKKNIFSACVVLSAPGYPLKPVVGLPVAGDVCFSSDSSYFLHAGLKKNSQGEWKTNGGRVLNAIGLGKSQREALDRAYQLARCVQWEGCFMRKDIGS